MNTTCKDVNLCDWIWQTALSYQGLLSSVIRQKATQEIIGILKDLTNNTLFSNPNTSILFMYFVTLNIINALSRHMCYSFLVVCIAAVAMTLSCFFFFNAAFFQSSLQRKTFNLYGTCYSLKKRRSKGVSPVYQGYIKHHAFMTYFGFLQAQMHFRCFLGLRLCTISQPLSNCGLK